MTDNNNLKYISLIVLVFQTTALVLTIKYSRSNINLKPYLLTSVILMSEIVKLICSTILILHYESSWNIYKLYFMINKENTNSWLKISVLSIIYVIQNNLLFVAVENLSPTVYQVSYQFKILTTGLFSVFLLGKFLSKIQYFSLFLLTIGIILVQIQSNTITTKYDSNIIIGLLAIGIASLTSGFAGVWFEKILKGSQTSLWIRNFQLAAIGIFFSLISMYLYESEKLYKDSIFQGYNFLVWLIILLQSVGGLVVAVVVKYADNILKGFATSISIILSCLLSIYLFDFEITFIFFLGVIIVCIAIYLYAANPYVIGLNSNDSDNINLKYINSNNNKLIYNDSDNINLKYINSNNNKLIYNDNDDN